MPAAPMRSAPRPLLAIVVLPVLLLATSAWAMNGFGGDDVLTRIPEPSLDFRAQVTDTAMKSFEVRKVSFDGHVYLSGKVGEADVSIPFEKISKVLFEPLGDGANRTLAVVTLRDGKQQALHVKSGTPCYGLADFGNVRIDVEDLRDATILGRAD